MPDIRYDQPMDRKVVVACLLGLCGLAGAALEPARAGRADAAAAPTGAHRAVTAGGDLIGAWQLRAIEYRGPHGETRDPYYQAASTGILIYDPSGWMSVQITAPDRRPWKASEQRVPASSAAASALVAAAFDSYYSYYGRWDFDPAAAVVTHHVAASLIPSEVGRSYTQAVSFEGNYLVFTNRGDGPGAPTLRRKIWERMPAQR
jgi:hypothetical protein